MQRLHVHVGVTDLDRSVRFYSVLFGAEPSVLEADYAKWMLDDPRVNFAISKRSHAPGIDHLGIQVDDRAALDDIAARLKAAAETTREQEGASCCYARSDKSWSEDPSGVSWEVFHSHGRSAVYGSDVRPAAAGCCGTAG